MRYPEPLGQGGRIGFIAPSFGCAIEPYVTRFENALKKFRDKGYETVLGTNCYESSGTGISNAPEKCAAELNDFMINDKSDIVISCGGGELMCEILPYVDFDSIAKAEPKWYIGYSDNTNYTFLSVILADTASIYGPCAPAFGREYHESLGDAMRLLTGEVSEVHGYEMWEGCEAAEPSDEIESRQTEVQPIENVTSEENPLAGYNLSRKTVLQYSLPKYDGELISGNDTMEDVHFSGRLIGGCMDILNVLVGTKYDKFDAFLEKYKDDGIIWFIECCDLGPLDMRRSFWHLREAGWFRYAKGFLIGRPLHFGEEALGVNQYNAVTEVIGEFDVPIIMDTDIGHLPPMMPIVCGSIAHVEARGNSINVKYEFV